MAEAIETPRLVLRPHCAADLDAFCALEADARVRRFTGGAPRTREQAEQKFAGTFLRNASRDLALRAALLKPDGDYVGYAGLYPADAPVDAYLAFAFAFAHWNEGLATEAGRALIAAGFGAWRLRRIRAVAESGNAASVRVLEKLGFELDRVEPGARTFHHFVLEHHA